MMRRLFSLLSMMALGLFLVARAEGPAKPKSAEKEPGAIREEARENQEILHNRFRKFEQSLLQLAQRLERSSKPEDRERAANLKKAIALVSDEFVNVKFEKLIAILKKPSAAVSLPEITDAMNQNKMLADDIRAILVLLMTDNRDEWLKAEKQRIMDLLKQLDKVIREQKVVRAQTEGGRLDKGTLGKEQKKVTKGTEKIAKAMSGDGKGNKNEGKGEGKGDGKGKGEGKGDGKGEGKGKGQGKGEGKGQGQGQGQGQGKQGQDQGQGQGKDDGSNSGNPQQGGTPGKKQVQDANEFQKQAEDQIKKENKTEASGKQDKAIDELEKARKRLEEILRQLREEEIERLLADLQRRCERMLQLQQEVYDGTVRVDRAIGNNPEKKPTRTEEQKSLQLSDREEEIVRQANEAIRILEAEGTAVAFPEAFVQVRDDAKNVARRLGKADVGTVTQVIELDIIATLKDMIEALKKAQQEMQNRRGQPQPPGPPQDQKLIDLLAELKMIRAMQVRVNNRTKVYAEKYPGEQAQDLEIRKELDNLGQRERKIYEVTNNIYKGKNR